MRSLFKKVLQVVILAAADIRAALARLKTVAAEINHL